MTKQEGFFLVFGLALMGMFIYGLIVLANALMTGKLLVAMRGAPALEVQRYRNPLAFWIYYLLTIAGTAIAACGAFYFLKKS